MRKTGAISGPKPIQDGFQFLASLRPENGSFAAANQREMARKASVIATSIENHWVGFQANICSFTAAYREQKRLLFSVSGRFSGRK